MNESLKDYRDTALYKSNQKYRDQYADESCCKRCGKPWTVCGSRVVYTAQDAGTFATCKDCWDVSTLEELKHYYTEVYKEQEASIMGTMHTMSHTLEHLISCVENEYFKSFTVSKPPLGIIPKNIWKTERLSALKEAVNRYFNVNRLVPEEWIKEYNELLNEIK